MCREVQPAWRPCKLTTLSMSFQVFSTVLRSAAGCFGGPTASWIASMMPKIRPLLRFGPRPPGFRPLRAVAMSSVLEDGRQRKGRKQSHFENLITFLGKAASSANYQCWLSVQRKYNSVLSGWFLVYYCLTLLLSSIRTPQITMSRPNINNSWFDG